MRKTILIAFFLGCLTSLASAGTKAGVTVSGYHLEVSGKDSANGIANTGQSRSEDVMGLTGSIFAEFTPDALNGVAIGLDVVPYDIEMGTVTNVRNGVTTGNQDNQSGTNSASVDMQYPITAYFLVPSEEGLFLKAGISFANLKISEKLTTSSTYPDQDVFGGHINVGYESELDGDTFIRVEAGYSAWETVKVKSSSGRNTVTADLDGLSARISIGKAF